MNPSDSLFFETHGSGEPIVFLHGAWLSSRMWKPQIEFFHQDHRVVTLDIRGHGRSKSPPENDLTLSTYLRDLRSVITTLQLEHPIVCGVSLGGMIAHAYAATYPDDTRGVVIANSSWKLPPIPFGEWYPQFTFPQIPMHATIHSLGPRYWFYLLVSAIEVMTGHRWIALSDSVREYAFDEVNAYSPREFTRVLDGMNTMSLSRFDAPDVPALLLAGDHETPVIRDQLATYARRLSSPSSTTIPDSGHLMNLDNPSKFNSSVRTFIHSITS